MKTIIESKIVVFKDKNIRRTFHNNEWWFVVADVVEALTESLNVNDYIKKIRSRDRELSKGGDKLSPPFPLKQKGVCRN